MNHAARKVASAGVCMLGLLACNESLDSRGGGTAVYTNGAAPVAPWSLVENATVGPGNAGMPAANPGDAAFDAGAMPPANAGTKPGMLPVTMMTGTGGSGAMQGTGGMGATAGTGGMAATTGTGGMAMMDPPTNTPPTSVAIDVTTLDQGGRYEPDNIGAIWVQDASGKYIKTLEVWATIRAIYLSQWLSVNPWGDETDAITSATLRGHKAHHATWDLKDSTGASAPDGDYNIFIEVTDQDFPGDHTSIKFTKGPKAQTVMPPDTASYHGLKLTYQ